MYVPCGEVGMASSHESSINGSRERVGSYYPLARPHAVPGVPDSTGGRSMLFGSPRPTARGTTMRRARNVAGVDVLVGCPGLLAQSSRLGQATLAGHRRATGCWPGIPFSHCGGLPGRGWRMRKGPPRAPGTVRTSRREDKSGPSYGLSATEERLAEGGLLQRMPWGSNVQSTATVDLAANFHWLSQEWLVAVARR